MFALQISLKLIIVYQNYNDQPNICISEHSRNSKPSDYATLKRLVLALVLLVWYHYITATNQKEHYVHKSDVFGLGWWFC